MRQVLTTIVKALRRVFFGKKQTNTQATRPAKQPKQSPAQQRANENRQQPDSFWQDYTDSRGTDATRSFRAKYRDRLQNQDPDLRQER